jgi:hypothetical protein
MPARVQPARTRMCRELRVSERIEPVQCDATKYIWFICFVIYFWYRDVEHAGNDSDSNNENAQMRAPVQLQTTPPVLDMAR